MQSTAPEDSNQLSHKNIGMREGLLKFGLVEPVLWRSFLSHVVGCRVYRGGTSMPGT